MENIPDFGNEFSQTAEGRFAANRPNLEILYFTAWPGAVPTVE